MRTMTMWASYLFEEEWLLLIYSRKNEVDVTKWHKLFEELWHLFCEYVSVVIRCWRRLKKMSAMPTTYTRPSKTLSVLRYQPL